MTLGAVTHQTATCDPTARAVGETPQAGPPPPCLEEMGWIGGSSGGGETQLAGTDNGRHSVPLLSSAGEEKVGALFLPWQILSNINTKSSCLFQTPRHSGGF